MINTNELKESLRYLLRSGLTQSDALDVLHELSADRMTGLTAHTAVVEAIRLHGSDDVEVDDNALFSQCDEGTWVMGWLWVPKDERGAA
jgi:hypothetical protein